MKALFLALTLFAVADTQTNDAVAHPWCTKLVAIEIETAQNLEYSHISFARACDQCGDMFGPCEVGMQAVHEKLIDTLKYVVQFRKNLCEHYRGQKEVEESAKSPCSGAPYFLFKELLCEDTVVDFDFAMAKVNEAWEPTKQEAIHYCWSARNADTCYNDIMHTPNQVYNY